MLPTGSAKYIHSHLGRPQTTVLYRFLYECSVSVLSERVYYMTISISAYFIHSSLPNFLLVIGYVIENYLKW